MGNVKIHVLKCGEISIAENLLFEKNKFFVTQLSSLFTPTNKRVVCPVYTFLIEHPQGLFLIDTGWSREISPNGCYDKKALENHTSTFIADTFRASVGIGQTAVEQLNKLGYKPEDITTLLFTSLDADHTSAIHDFKDAQRIMCAHEEMWWSYRYNPNHCTYLWKDMPIETFYFRGRGIGPDGRIYNLLEDESIQIISTPGHTKGTIAVKIKSGNKYVLLCSDNAYYSESWEKGILPGLAFNKVALKKSLDWIKEEASSPNCIAAISSHDPKFESKILEL